MNERHVAILAGTHREYVYFCREQGWPIDNEVVIRNGERIKTVYCDSPERMRGWFPHEFIRTGTWYRHSNELINEFTLFKMLTEQRQQWKK